MNLMSINQLANLLFSKTSSLPRSRLLFLVCCFGSTRTFPDTFPTVFTTFNLGSHLVAPFRLLSLSLSPFLPFCIPSRFASCCPGSLAVPVLAPYIAPGN